MEDEHISSLKHDLQAESSAVVEILSGLIADFDMLNGEVFVSDMFIL